MANTSRQLKLFDGHELLYFVDTRLAGGDPHAIFGVLDEHLRFLSNLAAEGKLAFAGPLDTATGANSGNGIYALRVASLRDAQAIVAQDPLHKKGIRIGHVSPWHRKKDWSVLPDPQDFPPE
jgi:uncharacterized protein YciI